MVYRRARNEKKTVRENELREWLQGENRLYLAAFARGHSVVITGGLITTDFARYERFAIVVVGGCVAAASGRRVH